MGSKGTNFLNIGKNKAKINEVDPFQKVTFKDLPVPLRQLPLLYTS